MVHQHFSLVSALTVWENIALGDQGRLRPRESIALVESVAARYGLDVDPAARVSDLTAGQRQRVELIKCLRRDPRILILDEPTSVLTRRVVRAVQRAASSCATSSVGRADQPQARRDPPRHRRGHDHAGAVASRRRTAGTTAEDLARHDVCDVIAPDMVAAAGFAAETVEASQQRPALVREQPRCSVRRRHGRRRPGGRCSTANLVVRQGEIVGLAGVEGNGQTTVSEVLSSLTAIDSGTVKVGGVEIQTGKSGAMLAADVAVIPEDRHHSGCVLDLSVAENIALLDIGGSGSGVFVDAGDAPPLEDSSTSTRSPPSVDALMWMPSGGNQQKVVLARTVQQPTRRRRATQRPRHQRRRVHELLRAAAHGHRRAVISTELEELIARRPAGRHPPQGDGVRCRPKTSTSSGSA